MKLSEILKGIEILHVAGDYGGEISTLCYDSTRCGAGSLFIAVPGLKKDGHEYIPDAIARGARFIIHEKEFSGRSGITSIRVKNSRRILGQLGKNFYHDPSAAVTLIGVTGTNGKTTVTFLLESILREAGYDVGVIGTINYRYGGKVYTAPHTTPEAVELQRVLREMVDSGVTHVAMEVSSHAIDMGRIDECNFDTGIFTNLSQDHLDYHGTMERYFAAKRRFFTDTMRRGHVIINGDDPWGIRLRNDLDERHPVTYGIKNRCTVMSSALLLTIDGISAELTTGRGAFQVQSPLMGRFNLYNILASATAGLALGIPVPAMRKGIAGLKKVPGRLERVYDAGGPVVLVDYAHTEDALKQVLDALLDVRKRRIITVFGCGGDRDRTKRPLMGRAVVARSDISIVTSDNPRTEDPLKIIEDIEGGIVTEAVGKYTPDEIPYLTSGTRGYTVIPDRTTAIECAVSIADADDMVLIAGKGHEDYQILGDRKIFFDDRVAAGEALRRRRAGTWNG